MASRRFEIDITAWNGEQLANRVERALINCRPVFDKQLKEDIQEPQFTWTGKITVRYGKSRRAGKAKDPAKAKAKLRAAQNGRLGVPVGSPRNIVDSGDFLRSQRAETQSSNKGNELVFSWGNSQVNYAGYIFSGEAPGHRSRDWIAKALEKKPFERVFAAEWAKLERRGL